MESQYLDISKKFELLLIIEFSSKHSVILDHLVLFYMEF